MRKINNARQENNAAEQFKTIVKKGNAADDEGEICPYCGSTDTALLDGFVDKLANTTCEAWSCGACGSCFRRDAKLSEDGKTVISSKTFAGVKASASSKFSNKEADKL